MRIACCKTERAIRSDKAIRKVDADIGDRDKISGGRLSVPDRFNLVGDEWQDDNDAWNSLAMARESVGSCK